MANYTKLRKGTYQSEGNGITFIGIIVTLIMGLLPFWQMREILIRTKSVRVVTPIVPKEENPYGDTQFKVGFPIRKKFNKVLIHAFHSHTCGH